ncbi:phytanoyl-CoA dioxygenase family protein [Nocardia sp. AB354]|uniref:phytanoyl-CoA dioxygenase family protein n=1 Tax=Nocardia sp. AB354 TaxID=3413283 RepID=UPI003C20A358
MITDLLTETEREQWNSQGYLHIRQALSSAEVIGLRSALTDVRSQFSSGKVSNWSDVFDAGNDRDLSIANSLKWCADLDPLVDHPGVFGKILGLMGPYLQLLGSEIFFRYPHGDPLVAFHTDQGPSLRHAMPVDREIQIKAQFFLTDLHEPDSGNFAVVPGSQDRRFPGKIEYRDVRDSVQIIAAAGDVVLFPLSLGHGVAPNITSDTRISVVLRYGQLFCRPVDYWTSPDSIILDRQTPRRRRLLGDLGARSRPGDVYGVVPDQLDLVYGNEWRHSDEARAEFEAARRAQRAYEVF